MQIFCTYTRIVVVSFIVIANWKDSGNQLSIDQASYYKGHAKLDYILCPNETFIQNLSTKYLSLCMQNLKECCDISSIYKYVLCNHASHITGNYDAVKIIQKIDTIGLVPIIFVKDYNEAVKLCNISNRGIIVFESHEYIGQDNSMNLDDVREEINQIKSITDKKICYGGSLNESNYKNFIPYVDGLCFGRLSRSPIFNNVLEDLSVLV